MAKRKQNTKRSLSSLPKGLPSRKRDAGNNPFESTSKQKRPKHEVHNRNLPKAGAKQSALARSLKRRQTELKGSLKNSQKTNAFVDRRIGEYTMNPEDQMLARIVKERSRRSRKISKFSLDDDGEEAPLLTHKGKSIDDLNSRDHVILSDDDEDGGDLEAVDTELHFGGGSFNKQAANPYGSGGGDNMADVYSTRKTELDDLIARRKMMKAERFKNKETQAEAFENMDESFKELSSLLNFRDKEKDRKERFEAKKAGTLTQDEIEMNEWDKEMKTYLFERRVKATDRTKTPEEIAAEEAERLQELETKRLARMSGDFEGDELSDISDDEVDANKKKKRKPAKLKRTGNADELDDSNDEEEKEDELEARFTADGLVYVDKHGNVVKRAGEDSEDEGDDDSDDETNEDSEESGNESEESSSEEDEEEETIAVNKILDVGARIKGRYRAKEQFDGKEIWYDAKISGVNKSKKGNVTYDITYDDGDYEDDVEPQNIRIAKKTDEEKEKEKRAEKDNAIKKLKRQKAKEKARKEMPFVFEVPTTLEALHDMIGTYASTGADASLIIERIHKANSVRLDKRNKEKMQNFYDVLLRRFIAVGDAINSSGDGGEELGRYNQLDALTQILYRLSQDSPECAGAVWSRRLGIFQNAHAKRLRDSEFVGADDDAFSAWPSTGTFLLLRALGHIFPVTDLRHQVVTPALLFLGQVIAQTPVRSINDLIMGVLCSGLMIEYTKEAKRIAPEALAFLAGSLRLFAIPGTNNVHFAIPSLETASKSPNFKKMRAFVSEFGDFDEVPKLSLEEDEMEDGKTHVAVLCSVLSIVKKSAETLKISLRNAESETFSGITDSLLSLKPSSKNVSFPACVASHVQRTAAAVSDACKLDVPRTPLRRRTGLSISERAIKSLAPRMEDPSRYSMSKDKGKSASQAAIDRTRREFKREQKAVSRELRLDAAFIENERRKDQEQRDSKERTKRNKNFAWLEGEQAAMNQQVRLGGGLISGGGTGLVRAKLKTGKMGIKKGGKF